MASFVPKLIALGSVWTLGTSALLTKKFSGDPYSMVLGTYEGFIHPDMAEKIMDDYQIRTDYFDHDQIVKNKFQKGSYSLATVSNSVLEELIDNGLLQEIDWTKLNLTFNEGEGTVKGNNSGSSSQEEIFSDVVKSITKSNSKLLKYGIPYFMNKLSFCYVGNEISELKKDDGLTWKEVIEEISKHERFQAKSGKPTLALVDDPRSVLSLSRFVRSGTKDVNSGGSDIYSDYKELITAGLSSSKMGSNFLFMDSNAVNLVDSLVAGDVQGAIMYNADCLYASYGGSSDKPPSNIHSVKLKNNEDIYFLDFMVVSNKVTESQKSTVYKFLKDVLLHDYTKEQNQIMEKEGEGDAQEYKYWLARNFDYVKYTPVVKKLVSQAESSYFSSSSDQNNNSQAKKDIFKIEWNSSESNQIKHHYESKLSDQSKSDMLIAFERFKNEI